MQRGLERAQNTSWCLTAIQAWTSGRKLISGLS